MISGVIVKSGDSFNLIKDYKFKPLPAFTYNLFDVSGSLSSAAMILTVVFVVVGLLLIIGIVALLCIYCR